MPVRIENTPNPNALKFTVGVDVGGPKTFIPTQDTDDPMALAIFQLEGVTSVFMTADFVTLTKAPDADWNIIAPAALAILEAEFSV